MCEDSDQTPPQTQVAREWTPTSDGVSCREEVSRLYFLTNLLAHGTQGRLRLCTRECDLPPLLPAIGERICLDLPQTLAPFRRRIEAAGRIAGLPHERIQELILAAGEAAMNGIVHAGGSIATLHGSPDSARVQVCVSDAGGGIGSDYLDRAILERGYTTAGSLGMGFSLMHTVADCVYLFTRPGGTTIILEHAARPGPGSDAGADPPPG